MNVGTMKRLNPETGFPFKRGDLRDDGFIFYTYSKTQMRGAYFKEQWLSPDAFHKARESVKAAGSAWTLRRVRKYGAIIDRYKMWKGCKECGYKEHPKALDLDHRDRGTKSFTIAQVVGFKPWAEIKAEIRKCDVLCANCHRIKSHKCEDWRKHA